MKFNFKTLCTVGALLCMGNVCAVNNTSIDANPSSEESNRVSITWKEFQNTAVEDLPKSIIIGSWCIRLDSSNIDRLLEVKDRINFLERYDLFVNAKDCEEEKLITVLSDIFFNQDQIDSLDLCNFERTSFPKEIWNLTSLKKLILSDVQITTLPKEIRNLKNLETLDLFYNESLIDLPKEIESLPNLDSIILNPNCDLSVRRFLTKKNHTAARLGITHLHFEKDDFDDVESLDLSNKDLNRVPYDIVRLKDLKKLSLSNNDLGSVPLFLRNVKNLEILDISHNNIASLPTKTWPFPHTLKYLTLNGELLKNIPDDRIESISNMHGMGESKVGVRDVVDLVTAKVNNLRIGNKQMLQKLGGVCIVELKDF